MDEQKKTVRDCLYSRIHVSVKTMDRFIAVIIAALFIAIVCGVLT